MTTEIRRIGFLADTHCRQDDGSDLPQQALDALAGCDLIVHLGDVGKEGVLERLRAVAPLQMPTRGKGEVIEAGGLRIGVTFDLTKVMPVVVDENGVAPLEGSLADALSGGFGGRVDAVAFGGTHRQSQQEHGGVLFFNPGSPTLPADRQGDNDLGSVAILDLAGGKPDVQLVRLSKS